jgi:DNA mismatch endonuclease (patch repair protein)
MTDSLSKEHRSWNMSRIRSKDTIAEKRIRSLLHRMGYRFRLHRADLPGSPDIVLKKQNLIIFCHGCFWHQHPGCKRASIPKTNKDYWIPKLRRNVERFKEHKEQLIEMGWRVEVIWECETKNPEKLARKLKSILRG